MKGGGGKREGAGRKKAAPVKLDVPVPDVKPPKVEKFKPSPAPIKKSNPIPKVVKAIPVEESQPIVDVERLSLAHKDPKVFLLALMNDLEADIKLRADAAKSLMPFMHNKLGEGGKKDLKQEAAKSASNGRFGASAPPLRVVGNK